MYATRLSRNKGFTLIELLAVVGIIAITMGVGLPSVQSAIASSRLTSSANTMLVALQRARSEAVKGNIIAGVSMNTTAGTWFVFDNTTATVIQKYTVEDGVSVAVATTPTSVAPILTTPTYRPDGRLNNSVDYAMTFSVVGSTETRTLTVRSSGRTSICGAVADPC